MKNINVVAAIIYRASPCLDNVTEIFITQRNTGDYALKWEFPGGKIEIGETPVEAIVREIQEELNTTVTVEKFIGTIEYDYPKFHLTMDCFWCGISSGSLQLLEHNASRWITTNELEGIDWLPADVLILDKVREFMLN
ncbi:MAG: (deoxy)nucleoside triphosphate pyrophosphohydrolase [Treponema sp.]|nr:(deoxy)nucleoside triphosphate pyrophosphohydrolase [Treponema sp.]